MTVAYDEQAQAVRTTASALTCWTDTIDAAADRLRPVASWRGPAADTAAEAVERLRAQARLVAERPSRAADALRTCAAELEQAAALQQRAAALSGTDAIRLQLEAADVASAALRRAAAVLYDVPTAAVAPSRGLGSQLIGFGRGAWQALHGMIELSDRMSPQRALVDPRGALRDRLDLARGLLDDVQHPLDTAKSLAGLDQLREGAYGEWLGGLVAGAVIPGGRAGRLEGLEARSLVRLVDKGGPVSVRIGLRLPRGYPVHIKDLESKRRLHILDGDDRGGGHRAGTGKGKSEFPANWSDDQIIDSVMKTAMRPEYAEVGKNGNLAAWGWHHGEPIKVVVSRDGHVITAHPDRGGSFARRSARIR